MDGEARNAILLRDVQAIFDFGVVRDVSDPELLERFLTADHAVAEAAFTYLLERHGPMVLHVCRQLLEDSHDAEDAFQATFLVFLRRAGSIRKRHSLASWLFGVALRVARRTRDAAIVRRLHERHAGKLEAAPATAHSGTSEWLAALHEEIARLPDRYREPIVLCHLQGLSTLAAAGRLACAHGTILSRLARARVRLRRRLSQRGRVESLAPFVGPWLPQADNSRLPAALENSTIQMALHSLSGRTALATAVAPSVIALTEMTLRTLFMTRITVVAASLATAAVIAAVTVYLVRPTWRAGSHTTLTDAQTQRTREKSRPIERQTIHSRNLEDSLYKILKRDHVFDDPRWPFVIKVREVRERALIDATFRHRTKGNNREYDAVVQTGRAVLRVDIEAKTVRAFLEDAEIQRLVADSGVFLIDNQVLTIPIPPGASNDR